MWKLSLPWWEFIIRGLVVYVFLIGILRATGKRQIGQMSPFDLVLLMVLSNAVQNSMNGGDNSVLAGVILSVTLVHDGVLNLKAMSEENISRKDLMLSVREAGLADLLEVRSAILEINGSISVIPIKH